MISEIMSMLMSNPIIPLILKKGDMKLIKNTLTYSVS